MVKIGEGLTATYNRFHDPDERGDDVVMLRRLHDALDRAVLDAYGWGDISATPEFLASHRDEADDETGHSRPVRWRYRWPDDARDRVLARLLALNAERAAAERLTADAIAKRPLKGPKKAAARVATTRKRAV